MYLKSLVLQGFKSFAQRVELLFPQGVTAIVGPNGSGKSNVSDAIRWVLGEQNIRSLRGSAMQDVIFAGTHSRKPLGMAEVSLTLDNGDFALPLEYAEITITRRTYRSGESEFFINRTPCRLRDIHDLLMDTGLGRGTLSVIGQGEVDAILSVRPEERRALIEEAAGITRYRTKRQAALERLKETEADLVRINDIIAEVERQLTPLEREAERATLHRQLKGELVQVETQLLLHDWAVRKEACDLWESRRSKASTVWHGAKEALVRVQTQRKESLGEVAVLQDRLSQAQDALVRLERSAEQFEAQAKVLGERLSGFQGDQERRTAALESGRSELKQQTERGAELSRARDALRKQAGEANRHFLEAEEQVRTTRQRIEASESFLQRLRSNAMTQFQRAADVQSELRRMATSIKERTEELTQRRQELVDITDRLQAAQRERSGVTEEGTTLAASRAELEQVLEGIHRGITELDSARRACVDSVQSIRGRITGVKSQRDALRNLEDSFEGFHEGVRACLQANLPWRDRVFGAVGSLLDVVPEHEVALEVALGAATQNVIVTDEQTAKEAIEYLKQTRAGRVTFLPLSSLRTSEPIMVPDRLSEDDEYVGIAAQLVRFDPQISRAVEYLLGRVLVTRTLSGAIRLNRMHHHISRVVSLEGDLVLASGPITGGHRRRREGSGLLSRSRRLADLNAELASLSEQLKKEQAHLEQIEREVNQAQKQRSEVEGRLQSILREMADKHRVSDVLRERIQSLTQEHERTQLAVTKLDESIRQLQAEHDEVSRQLGSIDTDKELQDSQVSELEQQLAALRSEADALDDIRSERRAAFVDASAELKTIETELDRAQKLTLQLTERLTVEEAELSKVRERLEQTQREKQQALDQAQLCRSQVEEQSALVQGLRNELAQFQESIDAWNEKEEAARTQVETTANELHKIELALERERVAYMQAEERLAEREIPVPPDIQGVKIDGIEPLRSEAKTLRRRLDELGDVNLNALEEFAALKDRFAFLSGQRDDLVEAREGLDRAIADMDATSRERLLAAFGAIQKALHSVFPRLFGGGKAELSWTHPDEPLESGIDMLVQPPGKRPQPLLTLSGGERALAAASLMFAIMTVRPSPFFVLDEVDAALDEANVDRFAQLLKEYGGRTQIVVITHRQGTMEKADALFGVTMERHGASQLVSLRLDDAVSAAP